MLLESVAQKIGVKVVPLIKRGEVKLSFPSKPDKLVEEFDLRLSKKKALALLLWIYNQKNEEEV